MAGNQPVMSHYCVVPLGSRIAMVEVAVAYPQDTLMEPQKLTVSVSQLAPSVML
jgi:hypothetical protein